MFRSNPFILVPTLNLIKPLDTHVQLLFLVQPVLLPASHCFVFLPSCVCLTPRPDPPTKALPQRWAPLGIIDSELRLASVPGDSEGVCRGGEHGFQQHTAPRLSTLHSLISTAHLKDVYRVWDWFLDYWVNGPAWKQLSHFCTWAWCSTRHFVIKPGHRSWMQPVPCFLEETSGNVFGTRN